MSIDKRIWKIVYEWGKIDKIAYIKFHDWNDYLINLLNSNNMILSSNV